MNIARRLAPWLVFPLCMATTVVIHAVCRTTGVPFGAELGLLSAWIFGLILGLERWIPYRRDWQVSDGREAQDAGHALAGTFLGARVGGAVVEVTLGAAGTAVVASMGHAIWPSLPPALDLLGVFVVADLGRYVQHRAHHDIAWLWPFHELHHDVDRLSVWKVARSHGVERVLQQVAMMGPLALLGAPEDAVMVFVALNSTLGMLDHSNVDASLGPLEAVIMGPTGHRLHHSSDPAEERSNYGSALVIWDRVFGTWSDPRGGGPADVGTRSPEHPHDLIGQIVYPFRAVFRRNATEA